MKEIIILVVMFFADPMHKGHDSVSINTYGGEPLVFDNIDKCMKWVWKDADNLEAYARTVYPNAVAVKEIRCVYKKRVM